MITGTSSFQVQYVDSYQVHRFDETTPLEETLIAFDGLVRQGKVLCLGVSEWTAPQIASVLTIARDLGLRSRIISNQPRYNMLWRAIEPEIVPMCLREGIGHLIPLIGTFIFIATRTRAKNRLIKNAVRMVPDFRDLIAQVAPHTSNDQRGGMRVNTPSLEEPGLRHVVKVHYHMPLLPA